MKRVTAMLLAAGLLGLAGAADACDCCRAGDKSKGAGWHDVLPVKPGDPGPDRPGCGTVPKPKPPKPTPAPPGCGTVPKPKPKPPEPPLPRPRCDTPPKTR